MSLTQSKNDAPHIDKHKPATPGNLLRAWLLTWEVYPILLVTGFLCLYRINTTEFNTDQAAIFSMARDAIRFGLIPITSNAASLGITNPPAVIYILLIPALFSANPLWAAVQQALLTTTAALLTYIFTRRYYGRLAGIVAALLYVTATTTIHYGRFIWQQNMMPPFVVLFMFALYWGVVDRRKGWFAPAVLLLGLLFQLHQSAALLVIPLFVAVVLAPKTIRWRDVVLAFVLLFMLYFPYMLWEVFSKASDLHAFSNLSQHEATGGNETLSFYRLFLSPYGQQPTIASSVTLKFVPWLSWLRYAIPLLLFSGIATALLLLVFPSLNQAPATGTPEPITSSQSGIRGWWANFKSNPSLSGLVLLLTWQILPVLILLRVTIILQLHYFIFLMPGPYILIGLFIAKVVELFRHYQPRWSLLRYAVYGLVALVVIGQLLGSVASVIDISSGKFDDRTFYIHYRNDLNSLQQAVNEADQLAQQRHLNHVYITTDDSTATALGYLSEQMQTPVTLFDATNCLVLPAPTDGPAVLLVGPYDTLTHALLGQYASATLVNEPARPGGKPFQLYVVTPSAAQTAPGTNTFGNDLQLSSVKTQNLGSNSSSWMVTQWNILRPVQPASRTTHNYTITAQPGGNNSSLQRNTCSFTGMRAGDQLLDAMAFPRNGVKPTSVTVGVQSSTTVPFNPSLGPIHFETYINQETLSTMLRTPSGGNTITIPAS
jgi:Dolichyl-phosphate-mannose-protein mannosyltransferase